MSEDYQYTHTQICQHGLLESKCPYCPYVYKLDGLKVTPAPKTKDLPIDRKALVLTKVKRVLGSIDSLSAYHAIQVLNAVEEGFQ